MLSVFSSTVGESTKLLTQFLVGYTRGGTQGAVVSEGVDKDGTLVTCWVDFWGLNASLSPIMMGLLKYFYATPQPVDSAPLI